MFQAHHKQLFALVAVAIVWAGAPQPASGEEADEALAAVTAPLPTLLPDRLREEKLGYRVTISMWGKDQLTDATMAIAKDTLESDAGGQAVWRIEYREGGGVPRSNTLVVRQDDLAPLERHYRFGEQMAVSFGEQTVTIGLDGYTEEEGPLPQPVLPNWDVAVLALPLAEGFETLARTYEFIHETVVWKVAVVGLEAVRTPAGTFESYKVALTCLHNDALSETAWVTKDAPYRIVRREVPYTTEMPQGELVMELARIGDATETQD